VSGWQLRITLTPPPWADDGSVCHLLLPARHARRAEAVLAGQCLWAGPAGREIEAVHVRSTGEGGDGDWAVVPWEHTCGAVLIDQGPDD
jgi:hypothetical protein